MKSVVINGYGTIGKRVADAVSVQDDMKVTGVSKTKPDFEARMAVQKGYDLYIAIPEREKHFDKAGIEIAGTVDEMISDADIVVDCTPGNIGPQNLEKYKKAGVKAIYQGGEDHDLTGLSFNSFSNYDDSYGADYSRVVSCNTTGLTRSLKPIDDLCGVKKIRAVMVRRGGDPSQVNKGPINAVVPNPPTVPSHHGPDLKTVMYGANITTVALLVPTTLMHQHNLMVELENDVALDDVIDILENRSRVLLLEAKEGLGSTAEFMEYAKELGRSRNDLFEIPIWKESLNIVDGELFYMQAVHQESDVVPENVDAIRAMLELESDNEKSIAKTNKAMGIL
ncbi:glyceraldehyde-3-phosphate dehydrogenase [Methanobrevibacter arboriphilus]|uniref:Glyceraldehyde-3-phosphate dehydrogenase n=1 Tax=Methanobrevibacter arboriphilus TaxID=39441 RepID=A0ACA8R5F5_METAZ|nr:phosphorylating glyceraldehyde-3-phosphate dehydrogenase [Methanobrevibacter arboriphilus]MCC7561427.1 phosphorylating glyceraldehyde-3-phosphate dehydrogenase [Methanobrevibacter arboriphilus]BBL62581.1 glyceraldehyde-3-phosphate dehydrogenase [Methanobrevibacter arboriphilus]GLI12660.1 glyceraldehyde-3-phosphate dehydrogenase [Methanobrevibacter arboriphilus]